MSFDEWVKLQSEYRFLDSNFLALLSRYWHAALSNQWRPIESCPINTPVLCFENSVVRDITYEFDGYCWRTIESSEIAEDFKPTHWMPLPEPPL